MCYDSISLPIRFFDTRNYSTSAPLLSASKMHIPHLIFIHDIFCELKDQVFGIFGITC